ncbi:MAG: TonB-dependent receptor [Bacteroidales bacterium]|nr:TonB-dependent receptor [Bacteroidales bacterium]
MNNTLKLLVALIAMALSITTSFAQQSVTGLVTDVNGDPLPGVVVMIKGTNTGTTTDDGGLYSISAQPNQTLVFTSLGMETMEYRVGNRTKLDVELREDTTLLDEVVVVGYGTQKKIHVTGSVSAVSGTELKKATATNVSQQLVGKLPGIITQQSLGQPGSDQVSILVRGYSSYNDSGTVLVLVDGVERDMNLVNPADIESITVLKDASATAVYGMKAANGVILVTTKRGDEGTATVSYTGRLITNHATALPQMMTGDQYMKYYNLGYQLDQWVTGVALDDTVPYFTDAEIAATTNGDTSDGIENTNWMEPLLRTTLTHQHNVSVSGGSKKVNYFVSGGFQDQRGFLEGHYNKRTNVRSNIDVKPNKDLKISLNLGVMYQEYNQPGNLSYANATTGGTIPFCLMFALPFVPKTYDVDPTSPYYGMATSPMRTAGAFVANAEYASQHSGYSYSQTAKIETSARVEYSIPFLQGLKLALQYSYDWRDLDSKTYAYGYQLMAWNFADRTYELKECSHALAEGNLYMGDQKYTQAILRPEISYNRKFGKHEVSGLFLYEQNSGFSKSFSTSAQNFALLDVDELPFADAKTAKNSSGREYTGYSSYIGRLNYAYDDRYLLEVSGRYDGSYKFGRGHRWGFFPAVSAGWVLSKEDFIKDAMPWVDLLKLRASAGEVGNDNVGAYLYRKNFSLNSNGTALGRVPQATMYNITSYPNFDLTWEHIRTYDVGFEFNAWKGLLGVEFDWFYKYTYDILDNITAAFPPSLGGHYPTVDNAGAFDNRGFELSLNHSNRIGDLVYRINGNVSWAHNRILKRRQADGILPWQDVIGTSWGSIWGLQSDGLYQTQEEVDNAPDGVEPKIGDIKYIDQNGDGKIDGDDYVRIARNPRPELMYALQADASWKGFDINIQFQGGALCDKMLIGNWANGVSDATPLTKPWYANYDNAPLYLVEQSWRPDNTDATYPRLSVNATSYRNNYRVSDFWKRNGAYLRLKNVSLGYTLPRSLTRKVGMESVRLFLTGTNLLTFTEFKYLDPESPNVVTGYYPQQRTLTFGLDLNF